MRISNRTFILAGILTALFMATFISPFASSSPDGLEKVAEQKGFLENAEKEGVTAWESSPIPDYAMPGIEKESFATGVAGFVGTVIIFIVGFALARLLSKKTELKRRER